MPYEPPVLAAAPVVRLSGAVALAGRFPVLAGVDLNVSRGEIVALQGPNGAGKTSLLRACAGLLAVVAGEATVLGIDLVAAPRAVRRRVGLLGHATGLYDDLSVDDNLRFAVRASGRPVERVGPALELLGLAGRLRATPVGSLSAGQRRRVAVAVLVARDPELWLLDEPHAGLDAEHRDLLDQLIRRAQGDGATVLLASHELDRTVALADRVETVVGGTVVRSDGRTRTSVVDGPTGTALRAGGGPGSGADGPFDAATLSPTPDPGGTRVA